MRKFLKQEIDVKGVKCVAEVKLHKIGLCSVVKLVADEVGQGHQGGLTAMVAAELVLRVGEVAGAFEEVKARSRRVQMSNRL